MTEDRSFTCEGCGRQFPAWMEGPRRGVCEACSEASGSADPERGAGQEGEADEVVGEGAESHVDEGEVVDVEVVVDEDADVEEAVDAKVVAREDAVATTEGGADAVADEGAKPVVPEDEDSEPAVYEDEDSEPAVPEDEEPFGHDDAEPAEADEPDPGRRHAVDPFWDADVDVSTLETDDSDGLEPLLEEEPAGADPLDEKIDNWKEQLLDLTKRNHLVDFTPTKTKSLPLHRAHPEAVAATLLDREPLYVRRSASDDEGGAPPDPETLADNEVASVRSREETESSLYRVRLNQKRSQEEKGVNSLFVAFGTLRWSVDHDGDELRSPLFLVEVDLDDEPNRDPDRHDYRITTADAELQVNPALRKKLSTEHGRSLPPDEAFDLADVGRAFAYADDLAGSVEEWRVVPEVVLGIFDFAKYSLYADLEENRDAVKDDPFVRAMNGDTDALPTPPGTPTANELDEAVPSADVYQVLDADASQQEAIEAAKRGASFVLQGPPGTGKSQTIANVIAEKLAADETVLFVSEKQAALDVVKDRLDDAGLGRFCLEVHGEKASKKRVLESLGSELDSEPLQRPDDREDVVASLDETRRRLNDYRDHLFYSPDGQDVTAYEAFGIVANRPDEPRVDTGVADPLAVDQATVDAVVEDLGGLAAYDRQIDAFQSAPWRHTALRSWQVDSADTVEAALESVTAALLDVLDASTRVESRFGVAVDTVAEFRAVARLLELVADRPDVPLREAYFDRRFYDSGDRLRRFAETNRELADARTRIESNYAGSVYSEDPTKLHGRLSGYGRLRTLKPSYRRLRSRMRSHAREGYEPGHADLVEDARTLMEIERLESELDRFADLADRLGPLYDGTRTDWGTVAEVRDWVAAFDAVDEVDAAALRAAVLEDAPESDRSAPSPDPDGSEHDGPGAGSSSVGMDDVDLGLDSGGLGSGSDGGGSGSGGRPPADEPPGIRGGGVTSGSERSESEREAVGSERDVAEPEPARPGPETGEAGSGSAAGLEELAADCRRAVSDWDEARADLEAVLDLGAVRLSGHPVEDAPFERLRRHVERLEVDRGEVQDWAQFHRRREAIAEGPAGDFLAAYLETGHPADSLVASFEASFYTEWLNAVYDETELDSFSATEYRTLREEFRRLDRQQREYATAEIQHRVTNRRPAFELQHATSSEQVFLKREIQKRRGHEPLRTLFDRASSLVTDLKPCFMMSPLSVGEYLQYGSIEFDTVVFDEASQIMPQDAVSSIIRGDQVIVAGDSEQLPPTSFFDADVDAAAGVREDLESILDETASLLTEQKLRWHYRSDTNELIAFSNEKYYDGDLETFPGNRDAPELGVDFEHVPEGVYDRGGSRRNEPEAERVVDLIEEHVAEMPERSLGVVAFSQAQAQAIRDEVEERRASEADLDDFVSEDDALEGFFVKSLENVQGDERDALLFSVGYGPDREGELHMNFGPLNQKGGERRLNVAVTRAKKHIRVVSSIHPEDVDLSATSSRGVEDFKHYLEYAKYGDRMLDREAEGGTSARFDSEFEAAVHSALSDHGFDVTAQVGGSGYGVYLAVEHPDEPGRYVLGIECDGAAYASTETARERDRTRQAVLEDLGWTVHRIWSPDWVANRDEQLREVAERVASLVEGDAAADGGAAPVESVAVDAVPEGERGGRRDHVVPYEEPAVPSGPDRDFDDVRADELEQTLVELVSGYGPLKADVAHRTLVGRWHVGRLSKNIRRSLQRVSERLHRQGELRLHDGFLWPDERPSTVAVRENTDSASRPVGDVPLPELAKAASLVLSAGRSMTREDLVLETARLYGYERLGSNIERRVDEAVDLLVAVGGAEADDGTMEALGVEVDEVLLDRIYD